jgi:hypothetical protein
MNFVQFDWFRLLGLGKGVLSGLWRYVRPCERMGRDYE